MKANKKFLQLFSILVISLTFYGCPPVEMEAQEVTYTYILKNELNKTVALLFFDRATKEQTRPAASITGNGILAQAATTQDAGSIAYPPRAFNADSLILIIDNTRKEIHWYKDLNSKSMINHSDYEETKKEGEFVYRITEINYENATPCDGSCN